MSSDRPVLTRTAHRSLVLAVSVGIALTGLGGANAAVQKGDGGSDTPAFDVPDLFGPFERILTGLVNTLDGASSSVISIGPGIVSGEAPCPRSTDGHAVDCAAAAQAVCVRAGFQAGLELNTTTRRICRGIARAAATDAEGSDCKTKTSVARALCW